jgi:hypothetical protein
MSGQGITGQGTRGKCIYWLGMYICVSHLRARRDMVRHVRSRLVMVRHVMIRCVREMPAMVAIRVRVTHRREMYVGAMHGMVIYGQCM